MKNNNLTENGLLEYLFSIHISFFCTVPPRICLKRNIPVINEKELRLTVHRIYAEYFNDLLYGHNTWAYILCYMLN